MYALFRSNEKSTDDKYLTGWAKDVPWGHQRNFRFDLYRFYGIYKHRHNVFIWRTAI